MEVEEEEMVARLAEQGARVATLEAEQVASATALAEAAEANQKGEER